MFVHQDVRLLSRTWLEEAERMLRSLPNLGAAGGRGNAARRLSGRRSWSVPPRAGEGEMNPG